MTNILYLQTPWSPLFFENITTEPINSKAEERRRAALELAKKEYDIVTENDRQKSEILRRRDNARKEVEQRVKYLKAELLILSLNRPLTTGSLSPLQEFVGYTVPGYSTLMFADDASKHAQLAREAVKNKQWGPALGNAIKVPADVTMGAVSLIPFTGATIKDVSKLTLGATKLKNDYAGYKISKIIDSNNPKGTISVQEVPILEGYMYHSTDGYRPHPIHPSMRGKDGKIILYGEDTAGSLKESNGKYTSVRHMRGNDDLIWWDTNGHNRGNEVYVTKRDDDAFNVLLNLELLGVSPYAGRYEPTYYVTKPIEVNRVIKFIKDPISGSYIPSVPGKITTNKMTIPELFQADLPISSKPYVSPLQTNKYGTVKYYGPTMGKTTAAKTNPRLVDFDDIVREEIQQLANKKGKSVRELKTESGIEYVLLLERAVAKWQANPANKDKTLLISNAALSNKPIFDNVPVIPSKSQFIARQVARGESDPVSAALYYDDLLKRNPLLKIDDRFVSDIESGIESTNQFLKSGGKLNYLNYID